LVRKEEVAEGIAGREGFSDPGFSRGESEPEGSGTGLTVLPISSCEPICGPLATESLNHGFGWVAFPGVLRANSKGRTITPRHIHLIPEQDGNTLNLIGGVRGVIPGKKGCR